MSDARARRSRLLKILGLASVVGVAATGAAVARAERRRAALTPDEVRQRLRARHAEIVDHDGPAIGAPD